MINSVAVTPESSKRSIVLEQPKKADYTPSKSVDSLVKTKSPSKDVSEKSDPPVKLHSEAHQAAPVVAQEPLKAESSHTAQTFLPKEREPLEENVQQLGKKVLERVTIGWKN